MPSLLVDIIATVVGVGVTYGMAECIFGTRYWMGKATPFPKAGLGQTQEQLDRAILVPGGNAAAAVVGRLESLIFFGSLWSGSGFLVPAWLAFKVASKWETWTHVVRVGRNIFDGSPAEELRVRNQWGSRLLQRFLIGTSYNLLSAMAGAAVALAIRRWLLGELYV
jgi:hypothetical protein